MLTSQYLVIFDCLATKENRCWLWSFLFSQQDYSPLLQCLLFHGNTELHGAKAFPKLPQQLWKNFVSVFLLSRKLLTPSIYITGLRSCKMWEKWRECNTWFGCLNNVIYKGLENLVCQISEYVTVCIPEVKSKCLQEHSSNTAPHTLRAYLHAVSTHDCIHSTFCSSSVVTWGSLSTLFPTRRIGFLYITQHSAHTLFGCTTALRTSVIQ